MLPLHYDLIINDTTTSSSSNDHPLFPLKPQPQPQAITVTKVTTSAMSSTTSISTSSSSESSMTTISTTPPLESFMCQLMKEHNVQVDGGADSIWIVNDNAKRYGPLNQHTRRSLQQMQLQLDNATTTKCCRDHEHRRHRWESGCSAGCGASSPTDVSTPPTSPTKAVSAAPVVLKLGKDMPLSSPLRLRREGSITGVPLSSPSSPIQFSKKMGTRRRALQRPRSPTTPSSLPWMKDISSSSSSSSMSPTVTIQRKC